MTGVMIMNIKRICLLTAPVLIFILLLSFPVQADEAWFPEINLRIGGGEETAEGEDLVLSLRILLLLTILSLAPSIIIMATSFTRIIIVLSLIRNALATQRMPPNQVLIGIAIFLTVFIMAPVWQEINTEAIQPYLNQELDTEETLNRAVEPVRDFMAGQTREKDLALFVNVSDSERPQNIDEVPLHVMLPAFVLSELKYAFQIGFLIYLPFIMIDMVVASILMSMGMMMLPPVMISLPFKLLLFILIDGWYLVIETMIKTFN
ncbi:MAG TPA: flagellar type III secretion system pore protein FliP [Halanaerobiales bacterium]|nr:flagellar type III secretion system pore protein FliP [Halanaerobiales bacterium]